MSTQGFSFTAQLLSGNEFIHSQQLKMNIDPSVFPSTRVSARYKKVEHIFSLAWHRVSFDFPSARVTAAGFLLLPWWKHEWSCCHTGTQVFDVASMSAGHMSKGSVWINGFSRDWWAVTDVRACCLPLTSLCFLFFCRSELFDRFWHTFMRQWPRESMKSAFRCCSGLTVH